MNSVVDWRRPSVWAVPAAALAIAAVVLVMGGNRSLFLFFNAWSRATGPAPWPYVTIVGDTAVALALFLPIAIRRPRVAGALAVGAIIATLFVHGLKPLFDLPRPPGVLPPGEFTVIGPAYRAHTFPSGHTTTIFLAAGLVWLHIDSWAARAFVLPMAVIVGISRMVVGVHWPLDVATGAAGGWLSAALGTWLAERFPPEATRVLHALLCLIGLGCAVALLAGLKTGYSQAVQLQYAIGTWACLGVLTHVFGRFRAAPDPSRMSR
ncbi:MAG: phosphatase PAP2 family protein [Burkholderiales bacterium]